MTMTASPALCRPRKWFGRSGLLAHSALLAGSPLLQLRTFRRVCSALEMFLAALAGKGAGSGWDSCGQTRALVRLSSLRKGMVVVDVGANNGVWSKELCGLISDHEPHFHMFECAPYCFGPLEAHTGDMPRRTVVRKAVSNAEGTAELHMPVLDEGGSGLASLHARSDTSVRSHAYETIEVPTTTLDRYAEEAGIDRIDILKVDAEEYFRGCSNFLAVSPAAA